MQVTFDHSAHEAANIITFYFKPERPFDYTAGQFIQLSLPHAEADERGQKHWFTLSSSPTDEFLTITTKFPLEGPTSTFKQTLRGLKSGTPVDMSDPMGDFVLPKMTQTPLVFVAGGIGITPFHSILSWLASTRETRPIKLLYAVHSEDEIIFQDTFANAGVHATIVVQDPTESWGGERGHISAEMILGLEKPTEDTLVYVSGPEPMVEQIHADLKKAGLRPSQLVGDFFPNYKDY
ncbi:MAG: hypothetical protein JWO41_546 [Candidatus Saccharibacteria bacterium]|nr:hypothetical protein [Candidatus Saccharibacteria bacterium]